jgi:hypothetical protein
MGNDNLRKALSQVALSADELADLIKVDPRTVRRWLTGQPPYPRHPGEDRARPRSHRA